MNQEHFEQQIRKFLKKVGINSQKEIENAVNGALQDGKLQGNESVRAKMTLELPELGLRVPIEEHITLE